MLTYMVSFANIYFFFFKSGAMDLFSIWQKLRLIFFPDAPALMIKA